MCDGTERVSFEEVVILPDLRVYPGGCSYNGKKVRLSSVENTFLTKLNKEYPKSVSDNALIGAVYGSTDWPEYDFPKVYACKIRKKLKPLGLGIGNAWGYGYCLTGLEAQ